MRMQYLVQSTVRDDSRIFKSWPQLMNYRYTEPEEIDRNCPVILTVSDMISEADQIPDHSVTVEFVKSDSEELIDQKFTFTGETATFKVGEGEHNHF